MGSNLACPHVYALKQRRFGLAALLATYVEITIGVRRKIRFSASIPAKQPYIIDVFATDRLSEGHPPSVWEDEAVITVLIPSSFFCQGMPRTPLEYVIK